MATYAAIVASATAVDRQCQQVASTGHTGGSNVVEHSSHHHKVRVQPALLAPGDKMAEKLPKLLGLVQAKRREPNLTHFRDSW